MQDEKEAPSGGRQIQFATLVAVAITISCVFIGQSAQQFADNIAPTTTHSQNVAAIAPSPQFNSIDYAATASIRGGTVIIGPCDVPKEGR